MSSLQQTSPALQVVFLGFKVLLHSIYYTEELNLGSL